MPVITVRGTVAAIVGLALAGTLAVDLTAERRPPGGWIWRCEESSRLKGGDIDAIRIVDERGEPKGFDSIAWKMKGYGRPGLALSVQWGVGTRPEVARDFGLDGELMIKLMPERPGTSGTFTLRRHDGDQTYDGPVALPGNKPDNGTGFFRVNEFIGLAPGEVLAWSYAPDNRADGPAESGIVDVAPLTEAFLSVHRLKYRLDLDTIDYRTRCRRLPSGGPYWP